MALVPPLARLCTRRPERRLFQWRHARAADEGGIEASPPPPAGKTSAPSLSLRAAAVPRGHHSRTCSAPFPGYQSDADRGGLVSKSRPSSKEDRDVFPTYLQRIMHFNQTHHADGNRVPARSRQARATRFKRGCNDFGQLPLQRASAGGPIRTSRGFQGGHLGVANNPSGSKGNPYSSSIYLRGEGTSGLTRGAQGRARNPAPGNRARRQRCAHISETAR